MRFDMHCHVIGGGTDIDAADEDVYYFPEDNHHWFVSPDHVSEQLQTGCEVAASAVHQDGPERGSAGVRVARHTRVDDDATVPGTAVAIEAAIAQKTGVGRLTCVEL